jgi:hypothetical protein
MVVGVAGGFAIAGVTLDLLFFVDPLFNVHHY